MTIDYKALGAKIKEYRKKENITQEQLSLIHILTTGGTRDITVTVSNGVVTAKNDKTGVEYTAQKENGKYSIELPESIGNNVTIIQTVAK